VTEAAGRARSDQVLDAGAVAAFERCIRSRGVAVFPADTVYGLACDPAARRAVERLYRLKGRSPQRSAAVMFFQLDTVLRAVPELRGRTREAVRRLLPGAITVLVANPAARFPLACAEDPSVLGLRVPDLDGPLAPLREMPVPVLQSSANRSGAADVADVADLEEPISRKVDLVLDAGPLPGTASTVVDLTRYEREGAHAVLREGAVGADEIRARIG
jgi:L-threonylcarbamoyladenylate synthase